MNLPILKVATDGLVSTAEGVAIKEQARAALAAAEGRELSDEDELEYARRRDR